MNSIKQALWALTLWVALGINPVISNAQNETKNAVHQVVSPSQKELLDAYNVALSRLEDFENELFDKKVPSQKALLALHDYMEKTLSYYRALEEWDTKKEMKILFSWAYEIFITKSLLFLEHHVKDLQKPNHKFMKKSQNVLEMMSIFNILDSEYKDLFSQWVDTVVTKIPELYNSLPD